MNENYQEAVDNGNQKELIISLPSDYTINDNVRVDIALMSEYKMVYSKHLEFTSNKPQTVYIPSTIDGNNFKIEYNIFDDKISGLLTQGYFTGSTISAYRVEAMNYNSFQELPDKIELNIIKGYSIQGSIYIPNDIEFNDEYDRYIQITATNELFSGGVLAKSILLMRMQLEEVRLNTN